MDFPPTLRAILWLDAVLLLGAGLALAGRGPELPAGADLWTWLALAGSTLTAVLSALAAFHLCKETDNGVWTSLPVPALALWIASSVLGYLTMPAGAEPWGDTLEEAAECFAFLLKSGLPLLALIVAMLWHAGHAAPHGVLAMGGLASAGAAGTLLLLVHAHASSVLDVCAHAAALVVTLAIAAAAARLGRP